MHDAAAVGSGERFEDLLCDARGGQRLEGAALANDLAQIAAVDQLHDDEGVAALHPVIEDIDHIRVVELRRGLGFLPEARHERRVAAVLGAQHLDRHVAAELRVVGTEDGRHAALAEQLHETIATGEDLPYFSHRMCRCSAEIQAGQKVPKLGPQIGLLQSQLDRGLQPAHRGPRVEAPTLEFVAIHVLLGDQRLDRVGELDLAACATLGRLERSRRSWASARSGR